MQSLFRVACFVICLAFASQASAESVVLIPDPGAGSWSEIESFEGLGSQIGPSLTNPVAGYLVPVTPFTFPSGITITQPDPNPGIGVSGGVWVGDWSVGVATLSLAGAGGISSDADVPFGSAYLAVDSPSASTVIEFVFPGLVQRVGVYLVHVQGSPVTLTVFGTGGASTFSPPPPLGAMNVTNWSDGFVGVRYTGLEGGISKIQLEGKVFAIDNLSFYVPEPSSMSLLLVGASSLIGLGWFRRKRSGSPQTEPDTA